MLSSKRVEEIFIDCLFTEKEDPKDAILLEGVVSKVGLNPIKVEKHKAEIIEMLDELPDSFKEGSGDGHSFLYACNDKHDNQWTGMHKIMEQLFLLGMAIKRVRCLMPRSMWSILPGGVPYYCITKEDIK